MIDRNSEERINKARRQAEDRQVNSWQYEQATAQVLCEIADALNRIADALEGQPS